MASAIIKLTFRKGRDFKMGEIEPRMCQSCGMPMLQEEDFADGNLKSDYCKFCMKGEKFTNPELTLEKQIKKIKDFAPQMGLTDIQIEKITTGILPKLKRWQKG